MSESPEETTDVSLQGRFNGIVVVVLVVVGVLGSAAMLYQLYGQTDAPAGKAASPRENPVGTGKSAAPAVAGTRFALRLQTFSDVANAEDLRAKLDALQIPSSISVEAHVQVGPFKTQEEVNAARVKLKELGIYGGELLTIK